MKISICGKGGSGKSTVVTLLAQELVRRGKTVLIVDADESNYGLHRHLGMEAPTDFMEYVGGKAGFVQNGGISKTERAEFMRKYFSGEWNLTDIPPEYYTEKDGIRLMCSGKIRETDEGCACPFHTVLKNFIANLRLRDDQVCLLDMEAGIEHFGRGIDDDMDLIFMVCDPSYESVRLSRKIADMAAEIGKPLFYILNKVDAESEGIVRAGIGQADRIVCVIPTNRELMAEGLSGDRISVKVPEICGAADAVTG